MAGRYDIVHKTFWTDPYPDLEQIRRLGPAVEVPQLGTFLITRRDDVFEQEKRVETFASTQPDGLMTVLMGQNMMRKDGAAHQIERRAVFPALSPRTVRDHWTQAFAEATDQILDDLGPRGSADLVCDFAMPVCGEALKVITGLTKMEAHDMDRVSQHMLDGCANYIGDPDVEARCHAATAFIDSHIDIAVTRLSTAPDTSVLSVQLQAGLPMDAVRANVKLVISGGQNEPRDAIAGTAWALLTYRDQHTLIKTGAARYLDAFEEYARWMSPIGMSPRRVDREDKVLGRTFKPGERVFFMFGAANRDPDVFDNPNRFDIRRDTSKSVAFGAGPHFCAGAGATRVLIANIALPKLFERFPDIRLAGDAPFGGWAFRGPLKVPVAWGSA